MNLLVPLVLFAGIFSTEIVSPIPKSLPELVTAISKPSESLQDLIIRLEKKPVPTPTITPTPVITLKKPAYTIVMAGDSMTDTFTGLAEELNKIYPRTRFTVENYGIGGTNLDDTISRITGGMVKENTSYPPITAVKPDLIIIESCAYNQIWTGPEALDHYWLTLAKAADTVRKTLPGTRLLLFATIAPNSRIFGQGAPGIDFTGTERLIRTTRIRAFLDNTVKFARSEKIPLADAFTPSLISEREGNPRYINSGDHIHYSPEGMGFVSGILARAISSDKLLR